MRSLPPFTTGVSAGLVFVSVIALSGCGGGGGGKLPPQGAASFPPPAAGPSAQPAAPAPVPSNKPIVDHTIRDGDSLWKIARDYKTTVREIKAANQLTSDFIVAGQTLRVPSGLAEGVAPGTPDAPAAAPEVPQGLPQPAAGEASQ